MSGGLAMARMAAGSFSPKSIPGLLWYTLETPANTTIQDAIAPSSATSIAAGSSGPARLNVPGFSGTTARHVPQRIRITGATSPANNGTFNVVFVAANIIEYDNSSRVIESFPGTYALGGKISHVISSEGNAYDFTQASDALKIVGEPAGSTLTLTACTNRSITSSVVNTCTTAACASPLNGNVSMSFGFYGRIWTSTGGFVMGARDATGTNRVRWNVTSTPGMQYFRNGGNSVVAYARDQTAPHLYVCTYTAGSPNGTHEEFVDGVSKGTAVHAAGSVASMDRFDLGDFNSGGSAIAFGSRFVYTSLLSTTDQARLLAWFQAQLP